MSIKKEFLEIFDKNINRNGHVSFRQWLIDSDFFESPASTKYHGSFPGGLCLHSINVYKRFIKLLEEEYGPEWTKKVSLESATIMSLLHDVCKVGYYDKTDAGYVVKELFPFGHGEKSVVLIMSHMKLTYNEALAINWHMGAFDKRADFSKISEIFDNNKIAFLLHIADYMASKLDE